MQSKPKRRRRSTNSCRPDIRETIARRVRLNESLDVRAIRREAGGSNSTILEELALAGVSADQRNQSSQERDVKLKDQLTEANRARTHAESEAKLVREMYDDLVARVEFILRKNEESMRQQSTYGATALQPVVIKELIKDEVLEARNRRLMNDNGIQAKKIEQLLSRLRRYEPDAE